MSYTGLVGVLFDGTDGLTGVAQLSQAKPNQLLISNNTTYEFGTIQKEGGAIKYNATPITGGPQILAGHDWWPDTVTQRMVVYGDDGIIYKDSGAGTFTTQLATGYSTTGVVPIFVEGGKEAAAADRKLFVLTGKDVVKFLSGDDATLSDMTSVPADWTGGAQPATGAIHAGRFMAAGNSNSPHTVYYSPTGNHDDMNGAGSGTLIVFPGEGRNISAIASYKGLLIIWKFPRGVYLANTTDPNVANWTVTRLTDAIGSPGSRAHVVIDNDIIWFDAVGNIQQLSSTLEFGNLESLNLSQQADMRPFIEQQYNIGKLNQLQSIYYAAKRQAHFALPSFGETVNNRRFVVDFMRLDRPRFRSADRDKPVSMWTRLDSNLVSRPVYGDDAGTVWLMDQENRSLGGDGYEGRFQTPHLDMSHVDPSLATKVKNGQFLELVMDNKGNWSLTVEVMWDNAVKQVLQFNLGVTGAPIGSFVLDSDQLSSDQVLNKRKRIVGSGKRFSMAAYNSFSGQDYSVARGYLHFVPGAEK